MVVCAAYLKCCWRCRLVLAMTLSPQHAGTITKLRNLMALVIWLAPFEDGWDWGLLTLCFVHIQLIPSSLFHWGLQLLFFHSSMPFFLYYLTVFRHAE